MRHELKTLLGVLLLLAVMAGGQQVEAAAPGYLNSAGSVGAEPVKVDGIGAITETLTFSVLFNSDAANTGAFVNLSGCGGPILPMTLSQAGTVFLGTCNWVVVGGTANNAPFTPIFVMANASGTTTQNGNPITVDNVPPSRSGIMTATVGGVAYTGQAARRGQVVVFTQGMTTTDSAMAILDLSTVGLPNNNAMTWGGFSFTLNSILFPDDKDGPYNYPIRVTDDRGNSVLYNDFNMNVDTKPPVITAATVVNAAGAAIPALPGHILNFSVSYNSYDADIVVASCTSLTSAGIAMPVLTPTSAPAAGSPVTFTGTLPLPQNTSVPSGNYLFEFQVTDNAGNIATRSAGPVKIDLYPPVQTGPTIDVYQPSPDNTLTGVTTASISTRLVISCNVTTDAGDPLTVTAKLAAIGGPASFPLIQNPAGGNTYVGTFTITPGSIENDTDYTFTVYAKDSNGNLVYQGTTPNVRVDSQPPSFNSAPVVTRAGGGSPIRFGDQVTISVQANNVEGALGGRVYSDLSGFGGVATQTFTNPTGNTWTTTFTLATTTIIDSPGYSFRVYAEDDVRNLIFNDSSPVSIDSEPPVVLTASWTVSPPLSATRPYVNIGASLTFEVILASTTGSTNYDGQTVFIDLSTAGGSANQQMTLSGGVYRYNLPVATGPLNDGATFPLTITDNAGNRPATNTATVQYQPIANASITVPMFDQNPPDAGPLNLVVTHLGTDTKGLDVINLNRAASFSISLSPEAYPDAGAGIIDLSYLGFSPVATLTQTPAGLTADTYATESAYMLPTATEAWNGYRFNALIVDKAGNRASPRSNIFTVDCQPPQIVTMYGGITGGHATAKVGHFIEFHVRTDFTDGGIPTIDLTALGKTSREPMVASTASPFFGTWWDYSVQIATGGTFNGSSPSFLVTLQDNAGNTVTSWTPALNIDHVPPQAVSPMTITWSDVPIDGRLKIDDSVTFAIKVNDPAIQIGTATINLTAVGGLAVEYMTWNAATSAWSFTRPVGATNQEFFNRVFTARLTDSTGNIIDVSSDPVVEIDGQRPTLSGHGLSLTTTNNDNPLSNVANANDVLTVYTAIGNLPSPNDLVATLTYANLFATDSGMIIATGTLIYNSGLNRYQTTFTVPTATGDWGILDPATLSYAIHAEDNVGNIATLSASASIAVDNLAPTVVSTDFNINPNLTELGYLNVGSGSIFDLLNTSVTLNEPITSAYLDLSQYPGAPNALPMVLSGATAATGSLKLTAYGLTEMRTSTFTATLYDRGGNLVRYSQSFVIDTRQPQINTARYDGATLTFDFSEMIRDVNIGLFTIKGTDERGLATSVALVPGEDVLLDNFTSCDIGLANARRRILAAWANSPLTLKVSAVQAYPYRDLAGNWGINADNLPITLTSTAFRDPPVVATFTVSQTWPLSPSAEVDLYFSKTIATETLVASNGVLFVTASDFTTADYRRGYVFQPTDTPTWIDAQHLRMTLGADGAAWMAKKLGSGTATLKFCCRTPASVFVRDDLGKAMTYIAAGSPKAATVARPYTVPPPPFGFAIDGNVDPAVIPFLDLGDRNGSLRLNFTDRALLYKNDFETPDPILPRMGMPVPSFVNRITTFHQAIQLHDLDARPATYVTLQLEPLDIAVNPALSPTMVKLHLTPGDLQNVMGLFRNNPQPNWRLKVQAGAFQNWWGQPNVAYEPADPGSVLIATMPVSVSQLAAIALSDPTPTKYQPAGGLSFEAEIFPTFQGGAWVPIASTTPRARIVRLDTNEVVASGTFQGWTSRQVADELRPRFIARFANAQNLPANLQRIPAQIEIFDVIDIFGNSIGFATGTVFDLAARNNAIPGGFTSSGDQFLIDSWAPSVTGITPIGPIGQTAAESGLFEVTFSEAMDPTTASRPVLELATGATVLPFTFLGWTGGGTVAQFSNTQSISPSTPNGLWTYRVTKGSDLAGNPPATTLIPVEIRSIGAAPMLTVFTRQPILINGALENRPFSPTVGDGSATILIDFTGQTGLNPPHRLLTFDAAGKNVATFTVAVGNPGQAIFTTSAAFWAAGEAPGANLGPVQYRFKLIDSLNNPSPAFIGSLTFDSRAPSVSSFGFNDAAGIATMSPVGLGFVRYYSPLVGAASITLQTNATDQLRLVLPPALTLSGATETRILSGGVSTTTHLLTIADATQWPEGLATLSIADLAGNPGSGVQPSLKVQVDRTVPTVLSVWPNSTIGATPANTGVFEILFSEPMNPAIVPTVRIASGAVVIRLSGTTPDCWVSPTLCRLTNLDPISNLPVSTYTWQISGARDFAGNPVAASNYQVFINSRGTNGNLTILTRQPHLTADVLVNTIFSPSVGDGSATILIDFTGQPVLNPPYRLLTYNDAGLNIATFPVTTGTPGSAIFKADPAYWAPGYLPGADIGPVIYRFRLLDALGNLSSDFLGGLTFDSRPARVSLFDFNDGGRGQTVDGVKYYAPIFGSATITLKTDVSDAQRLVIASTAAQLPLLRNLSVSGTDHSVFFGGSLGECLATFTCADPAGNLGAGPQGALRVKVDRTAPRLSSTIPSLTIGAIEAGAGTFDLIFSEPMQAAFVPTARLENGGNVIRLEPIQPNPWINATTCRYRNVEATRDLPIGTYTFAVNGGRDLAGLDSVPNPIQIYLNSIGAIPDFAVLTRQPEIFPDLQINQPFSPVVGDGSATIRLVFTSEQMLNAPFQLLVYDQTGAAVATLPMSPGTPGYAIFPGNISSWVGGRYPTGSFGPTEYSFKVVDFQGTVSPRTLGTLTFDSMAATLSELTLDDTGRGLMIGSLKYYSPALGSATIKARSNSTDRQRLLIASDPGRLPETTLMNVNGTEHTLSFGGSLADGVATMSLADLAGNRAVGPVLSVVLDRTAPRVTAISPSTPIGAFPSNAGRFDITFSEPMQPGATPNATLRNGDYVVTLIPVAPSPGCWVSSTTIRMTNIEPLENFPAGIYSYIVETSRDLAGNPSPTTTAGQFTVEINPISPAYTVSFRSRQQTVSGDEVLIDRPFSPYVPPQFGHLSVEKTNTSPGSPADVWIFGPGNVPVASVTLFMSGTVGTATINASVFGTPGQTGPVPFTLRIGDNQGNLSAPVKTIIYDGLAPSISTFTLTNVSTAVSGQNLFSPLSRGSLNASVFTDATDSLRLVLGTSSGNRFYTLNKTAFYRTGSIPSAEFAGLPDGDYTLSVVDEAGNLGGGLNPSVQLRLDATVPLVTAISALPPAPLRSLEPGTATMTVTFSESMNRLASAAPTLGLATDGRQLVFRFVRWQSDTQAQFVNESVISPDLPQGPWDVSVKAWDLADNTVDTILTGALGVGSRGPRVESFWAESYQPTTATGSYPAGVVYNQPFSMSIWPNSATLKINLFANAVEPVQIQFLLDGQVKASYPLTFANRKSQFIWNTTRGPLPAAPSTYQVRLADALGNVSVETFDWRIDSFAPVVSDLSVTGGVTATGTRWFNPALHGHITTTWTITNESDIPRLRIRGGSATGTIAMTGGNGIWTGMFNGVGSSGTLLPDGIYTLDSVDAAGNVGRSGTGQADTVTVGLDTTVPDVASITLMVNGEPKSRYAPKTGNLEIWVDTAEPLEPSAVWFAEVRTDTGTLIRTIPLESVNGSIFAAWDGTRGDGRPVADGWYRVSVTDIAGNRSTASVQIQVQNLELRLTGVTQLTNSSFELTTNLDLDPNTAPGATIVFDPAGPAAGAISLTTATRLKVDLLAPFSDAVTYKITVTAGTLLTTDGIGIADGKNTVSLLTDARGPALSKTSFEGVTTARGVTAHFTEAVTAPTCSDPVNYDLRVGTRRITITSALLRSDNASVLLTAAEDLTDTNTYTLTTSNIQDRFGNPAPSSSKTFKGQDLVAPKLSLAIFSNPAAESDIMIAASSNEDLRAAPTLTITQSGGSPLSVEMTAGSRARTWMAGYHLDPNLAGVGTVKVQATDLAGNAGSAEQSFTIALINASIRAEIHSPDGRFAAIFAPGATRNDMMVKVLPQELSMETTGDLSTAHPRPSYRSWVTTAGRSSLRKNVRAEAAANPASLTGELIAPEAGYEISFDAARLAKAFQVSLKPGANSVAGGEKGLGLFRYDDNTGWTWLSSTNSNGLFNGEAVKPGVLAILRDTLAPRFRLSTRIVYGKPLTTDRPRFDGRFEDLGAGIDPDSVTAEIDGQAQPVTGIASDGRFVFTPLAPLTGGEHEIRFSAADRTGNPTRSEAIRFQVQVPLSIGEVSLFPNPARGNRVVLRIGANRDDIRDELVEVRIFDTAGHPVRWLDGVRPVKETAGAAARFRYDVTWDLRNDDGRNVANGLYIARISITDPDTGRKIKRDHKIAVLK